MKNKSLNRIERENIEQALFIYADRYYHSPEEKHGIYLFKLLKKIKEGKKIVIEN